MSLVLLGSTSGSVTLQEPAVAGSTVLNLPATSGTMALTSDTIAVANGGTGQTSYTNGQLLIGNTTGNTLTKATLTAGTGISVTNGTGSITIANTASVAAATPTALGTVYGKQTTSGGTPYLTAYGYSAGTSTTGIENVAFGVEALELNVTGTNNTMLGTYAGSKNTSSFNVAVGSHALRNNTSGTNNIAIGYGTLVSNITNSNNVGVGHQALNSSTGSNNTAVGYKAGFTTTSGLQNTIIGADGGNGLTTGNYNTYIGHATNASAAGVGGEIAMGNGVTGQGAAKFTFGQGGSQVTNQFNANANWSQSSDARIKRNVQNYNLGLSFIEKLRTVSYQWLPSNEISQELSHQYYPENQKDLNVIMQGFIAQEVKAAMEELGDTQFNGWDTMLDGTQTVSREMFVIPLINAVKELKAINDTQASTINALTARIVALEQK